MNKNTKHRKLLERSGRRQNFPSIIILRPSRDYHSNPRMENKTISISLIDKNGVVSQNRNRNMQQKIYFNTSDKGGSATFHEPINKDLPFFPKKRKYTERKQSE